MKLIKSIEINYLRSIHRLRLSSLGDLTVFSGRNDVGKSNLLKALNLFFNNQVDGQRPLDFYQDFSLRRLDEVRRESIKGKQFISITVQFDRPRNYENSLPPTFRVKKTWLRDSLVPQVSNDLDKPGTKLPSSLETARRMLSQFTNRLRFEYIPAVKDRAYFEYILRNLQETLLSRPMNSNDPILRAVRDLNATMSERAQALRRDFEGSTSIEADVSLPEDPATLFKAFSVSTRWQTGQEPVLPLTLRGDGIQARYVPSLLHYIAANSNPFFIWGFEEPENSVEYNLAMDLAEKFEQEYSRAAQIFVTSHSPAFVALKGRQTVSYRVYKQGNTTEVAQLHPTGDAGVMDQLADDLGLLRIQEELHRTYVERRADLERVASEANRLRSELATMRLPVVYVEGKTDQAILRTAWEKLFGTGLQPFVIKNCDPNDITPGGGSGGASTLAKLLSTVQSDSPVLVLGVFDGDVEGIKEFGKLPKHFVLDSRTGARISQNRRAAAIVLPTPPGREQYAEFENIEIECYFRDEVLELTTPEGWGLEFRSAPYETFINVGGKSHRRPIPAQMELTGSRTISDGKTVFAEAIVPTLPSDEFEVFRALFATIQDLFSTLDGQGSTQSSYT